ncbi:STAS domain-containing protein [Saccharothrix syringae]|uniref:Anti-sigma factor antagonist n=1 Tax=Saccharothrix syringae TaxID=103733 RepID=A0A5Q0GYQ9_SACSY|nr:STAS domain-containing protein [Saccharothrix syringae]QFZ19186.1 anti-sigma factor antagonist [Saccharothrix syringae]
MTALEPDLRTRVDVADGGRAVLLHVRGEVDQGAVERLDWAFTEAVGTATRVGARLLLVELGEVEYFASVGMTALLHAQERADRCGVELVVVAPARHLVTTLLAMTGLDTVIRVVHSADDALAEVDPGTPER